MRKTLAIVCLLLVGATVANAGTVYAVNLRGTPNTLLSFPTSSPAANYVADVSIDTYAVDFNSMGTDLYAVNAASPVAIGTLDTTTGAYASNATISGLDSSDIVTGLSCDPITDTFYLSTSRSGVGAYLYTLDTTTGVATQVAAMGDSTELFIDIAIGPDGQMYSHDIANNALYAVDKVSGDVTLIGSTGFTANYAQGMDFDYEDGNLYAALYTGGGTGSFVQFDLTTGAANVIVDTSSWNAEMEIAINSPIPEPASLALFGLAGLALLRRR